MKVQETAFLLFLETGIGLMLLWHVPRFVSSLSGLDCIFIHGCPSVKPKSIAVKNCPYFKTCFFTKWVTEISLFSSLQKKLIMVGSCQTLSKVPLLKLLIEKVDEQSGIFSVSKKDINLRELKRCSQIRWMYTFVPYRFLVFTFL